MIAVPQHHAIKFREFLGRNQVFKPGEFHAVQVPTPSTKAP